MNPAFLRDLNYIVRRIGEVFARAAQRLRRLS